MDLWTQIWNTICGRHGPRGITIRKYKSHATQRHIDDGTTTSRLAFASTAADHFAAKGAKANAFDAAAYETVDKADALSHLVLTRLIAVVRELLATPEVEGEELEVETTPRTPAPKLDELVRQSNHVMVRRGRTWQCSEC